MMTIPLRPYAAALAVLAVFSVSRAEAISITISNPGFEEGFVGKVKTGFDLTTTDNNVANVPGWINTGTNYTDSGVEQNNAQHTGLTEAFLYGDDDGAYQITNYQMQEGDTFTLSWYARFTGGGPAQNIQLFAADTTTDPYSSIFTLITSDPNITETYQLYTLSYTATAANAGKFIGLSFDVGGGGGPYMLIDDFSLDYTPLLVPEPGSASLLLGALGMFFLRSRGRTTAR